jgi:tRNA-specific 2-thiouridylase
VKLAQLFGLADRLGATRIATGHYARIVRDARGDTWLARATDRDKDQSYFLYASPRTWLDRLVFPLGESTKTEVRTEAVRRGLPGATKRESQELCFVPPGAHAYADFVADRAAGRIRPGVVVDDRGRTVGAHEGVHRFTIGQRKGLGVALGRPAFVTHIDPESATVHLGVEDALLAREAELSDVSLSQGLTLPARARVVVRYRHDGEDAVVERSRPGHVRVRFDAPVRAIAPGQIAVFYECGGDRVLGGGRVTSAADRGRSERYAC